MRNYDIVKLDSYFKGAEEEPEYFKYKPAEFLVFTSNYYLGTAAF